MKNKIKFKDFYLFFPLLLLCLQVSFHLALLNSVCLFVTQSLLSCLKFSQTYCFSLPSIFSSFETEIASMQDFLTLPSLYVLHSISLSLFHLFFFPLQALIHIFFCYSCKFINSLISDVNSRILIWFSHFLKNFPILSLIFLIY